MHNKSGFSLVEIITYLALFMLIVIVAARFVSSSLMIIKKETTVTLESMALFAAAQCYTHDIEQSYPDEQTWFVDARQSTFKTAGGDRGWEKRGRQLFRITGSYDFRRNYWLLKNESLILDRVKDIQWIVHKDQSGISHVDLTMIGEASTYQTAIYLMNRVIA